MCQALMRRKRPCPNHNRELSPRLYISEAWFSMIISDLLAYLE